MTRSSKRERTCTGPSSWLKTMGGSRWGSMGGTFNRGIPARVVGKFKAFDKEAGAVCNGGIMTKWH
jgi:hypothetical protein